ncbi:unnamed protein product [Dibothriocephalus latus]|uniref:Uncharacterized protein n=1 Tax=Dibothriocephalus latus TaxID=60516 RepID=A0A3P7N8A8_DIBLA|nr:unnamed protein product [Dibothriocephalus latus]
MPRTESYSRTAIFEANQMAQPSPKQSPKPKRSRHYVLSTPNATNACQRVHIVNKHRSAFPDAIICQQDQPTFHVINQHPQHHDQNHR